MSELLPILIEQAGEFTIPEVIAVVTAILYLLLAIRQNIWCWFFAAISTAIYVYLFVVAKLYMESVLNVFYLGMALYGWRVWSRGRDETHELPVTSWTLPIHIQAIGVIIVVSMANGMLLERWTDAEFPYIDSLTTWGAIWTTFLVARKVFENWWYWLVIDLASIFIYWQRDLQLTALLFAIYIFMIPFGLVAWNRSRRESFA